MSDNANKDAVILTGKGIDGADKSDWQYVEVPFADMFDKVHQGAEINGLRFERGKTYFMPPKWADELRRILKTMDKADRRIMQATPDVRSIAEQERYGQQNGGTTFLRN